MPQSSEHRLGVALVAASAVVFGLAGVLTKSIDADALTVTCWRGLIGGALIACYVWWRRRGPYGESLRLGGPGWTLAVLGTVASIAFIAAFKNTYVANVVVIYATIPFVVAVLAWLIVGEVFRRETAIAAAACLFGVAIMVRGGLGSGHVFGDLLALVMTLTFALYATLVRRFRNAPVVWAGAVSAILGFFPAWFVSDPLAVPQEDWLLLAAFGCAFALAAILWTEGARRIPAAEAGLLGTAEVPFGILFAWLFLGEAPPMATLAGGAIVLGTILLYSTRDRNALRPSVSAAIRKKSENV